jgi:hypothetical protein
MEGKLYQLYISLRINNQNIQGAPKTKVPKINDPIKKCMLMEK